jgi:cytochrome P450
LSTLKLPPGPKGRPVFGNMLGYARDPLGFLTLCSREYGDVVRLRFPGTLAYLITHPDDVEQVLVKNNRNFIKDKYTREELSVLGNGLLINEGDFWRRQRRLAQPAFHRRRVEAYGETMVAFTGRMLEGWRDGEVRDVHKEMMRLTLEIVVERASADVENGVVEVSYEEGRVTTRQLEGAIEEAGYTVAG